MPAKEISALTWSLYSNSITDMIAPIACDLVTFSAYNIQPKGSQQTYSTVRVADGVAIDNLLNAFNVFVQMGEYVETVPAYTKTLLKIPQNAPQINVTASGQVLVTLYFYTGTFPGSTLGTNYLAVQTEAALAIRTGTLDWFAGQVVNIPIGSLLADGAAVSRTTYQFLFSKIGTIWGAGDGSTTFNLPNAIGCTIIGAGARVGYTTRVLGTTYGAETAALVAANNGPHGHGVTDPGHQHFSAAAGIQLWNANTGTGLMPGGGTSGFGVAITQFASTGISIQSQGSGTPFSIMQPSIACNPIIWT